MTTAYPGAIDSFDTHVDNVDDVMAADVNNPCDSIVAIETALGVDTVIKTAWTPVLSQDSVVAATATNAYYRRVGKLVHIECKLVATAVGTAANAIVISGWPAGINPSLGGAYMGVGSLTVYDVGATVYPGIASMPSATEVHGFWQPTGTSIGANPNITLAVGDEIYFNATWFIA